MFRFVTDNSFSKFVLDLLEIFRQAIGENQILIPLLEAGLHSKDTEEISKTLEIIQSMDEKPIDFIPDLQMLIKNRNPSIQDQSFRLLLDYGIEFFTQIRP